MVENKSNQRVTINVYGGFAKHYLMNEDGLALGLCHELGHVLGGAPFRGFLRNEADYAVEGQSDYFATLKCMRRYLADQNNRDYVARIEVDPLVRSSCDEVFGDSEDAFICMRSAMAGKILAQLFNTSPVFFKKNEPVAFNTPDQTVVSKTMIMHPHAQCRLDTYFQGALCAVDVEDDVSFDDLSQGVCNQELGYQVGNRPQCWFFKDSEEEELRHISYACGAITTNTSNLSSLNHILLLLIIISFLFLRYQNLIKFRTN